MKVLFVSTQGIFSNTRYGGAKRLYYLARELEARTDLHVVCMDGTLEIIDPAAFPVEFRNILFIPLARAKTLGDRIPFLYDFANALEWHRDAIAEFLKGHDFDAVFLAYPGALHFINMNLISWPKSAVYLEDDLLPERMELDARSEKSFRSRFMKRVRYWQAQLFYRNVLKKISRFVCISPQEEQVVRSRWPRTQTSLLGYGLPLENFPLLPAASSPMALGFIGNYGHAPNADAAFWLVETLFPLVQARIPEARLVLCGPGFPEALRARCEGNASIQVLGNVADLAIFYGSITVFVNAVRTGRGLRTKVIEAAAYGRPIVSTPLGAEGLEDFDMGFFGTGDELADLLQSVNVEGTAQAVARNRAIVERDFSMETVGGQLLALLRARGY
jgi:glycosyltransferase involved in cell wall biosynthesis